MPTYDFRCPNGHTFQKFFKTISAAPAELPCNKCTEVASRQLSGGAGLVFKGSGFYLTDYGKNAHRKSAPGSSSESKSDGGKTESAASRSETKSETKTDSAAAKSETPKASDSSKSTAQSSKPKSE